MPLATLPPIPNIAEFTDGETLTLGGRSYLLDQGIIRNPALKLSSAQKQTQETFGFKWHKESTFDSEASLARMRSWLNERYLPCEQWLERLSHESDLPLVLDAGCGGGLSGFEYWKPALDQIEYFGIDVSNSVDVAKRRFDKTSVNTKGFFMQEDIANLPFTERMFDVVFSEGVLHHTDNTEKTFAHLAKLLKPGGLFMFYIYRKKGPIREYTDDYIRDKLQSLSPEQGWQALEGLTHLGIELGKLDIEIDVPEDIDLIDIPKGKINLQRLFYWHVFKAFYDPNLTFDEMHHINFDWYAPKNARRHTAEEVNSWCTDCDLKIERLIEEPAGITCIAQKV